jgi:hypothetical protein
MDVPSECTIVKTIEWVGPAYGQRKDVASGSGKSRDNTQKRPVKKKGHTRKLNRIRKAPVRPSSL